MRVFIRKAWDASCRVTLPLPCVVLLVIQVILYYTLSNETKKFMTIRSDNAAFAGHKMLNCITYMFVHLDHLHLWLNMTLNLLAFWMASFNNSSKHLRMLFVFFSSGAIFGVLVSTLFPNVPIAGCFAGSMGLFVPRLFEAGARCIANRPTFPIQAWAFLLVSVVHVSIHYGMDDASKRSWEIHPLNKAHPAGEARRMLSYFTHMFVHEDDLHLWGNTLGLMLAAWTVSFNRTCREVYLTVLPIYFSSGALGGMIVSNMYPDSNFLGCSDGVTALFGICLVDAGALSLSHFRQTSDRQIPRPSLSRLYLALLTTSFCGTVVNTIYELNLKGDHVDHLTSVWDTVVDTITKLNLRDDHVDLLISICGTVVDNISKGDHVNHLPGLTLGVIFSLGIRLIPWLTSSKSREPVEAPTCPHVKGSIGQMAKKAM